MKTDAQNHTPGPWQASADGTRWKISTLAFLAELTDGPDDVGPLPIKGTIANARLISSAPELFSALEFLLADYVAIDGESLTGSSVPADKARAALRKAKGE